MKSQSIQWILNGCGMEAGSITGGPVRFHEISRRWQQSEPTVSQQLMTTLGGETMLRKMGCHLPVTRIRASLIAKRERFRAMRLWSYLLSALTASRAVEKLKPCDAVITVSDYFCDIVPALAMKWKWKNCHWIAWIHHRELPPSQRPGNRAMNTLTWKMQEWSLKQIARHADAAWVYDTDAGDQVKTRLLELGMRQERIRIMKCGINLEQITTAPESTKTVDAVMVGVRPNKGLYDILPVWEEVLRLRPGTTLRLMGGMSGEADVLNEMQRRGLRDLIIPFRPSGGFLPPDAYYAKIKEAKILFAPSHEEGWGMAVCEAMAAGLPVVAYALPVYRRIYGEAFCSVPCFDKTGFAQSIVNLLSNTDSFTCFQTHGLACAAQYDWDALAASDAGYL